VANHAEKQEDDDWKSGPSNKGPLIVDAACVRADIRADIAYPTDFALFNEARQMSERIIDELSRQAPKGSKKPRTYCQKAWIPCRAHETQRLEASIRSSDSQAVAVPWMESEAYRRLEQNDFSERAGSVLVREPVGHERTVSPAERDAPV
jgi:hypothetical protein